VANLFDMRFVLNTGKGGVGKTVVSAAMAIAFARRNKRVLLVQLNADDRLGETFGRDAVGTEIVEISPGIHSVNMTPEAALREYALMILKVRSLYRAVFENRIVAELLRVMPGLPELTMLGKAYYHEKERDEDGRPRWDVIIVDAPATGHGMFLLQIPQVITRALDNGHMAAEAAAMLQLLEDHERCALNLITLPEEMPVTETFELYAQVKSAFEIQVGMVIANGVVPSLLSSQDAEAIERLLSPPPTHDALAETLRAGRFRARREEAQAKHLARLRETLGHEVVELPYLFEPTMTPESLGRLAEVLAESLEGGRP